VLLILGNREARVFYVGFDRRDIQVDESFQATAANTPRMNRKILMANSKISGAQTQIAIQAFYSRIRDGQPRQAVS
jgi:hypothetical protein